MTEGQCLVNYQMAESLKVDTGDHVWMRVNMYHNLLTLIDVYNAQTTKKINKDQIKSKLRSQPVYLPCQIKKIGDDSYGKFPIASASQQILMEYAPSVKVISAYLPPAFDNETE